MCSRWTLSSPRPPKLASMGSSWSTCRRRPTTSFACPRCKPGLSFIRLTAPTTTDHRLETVLTNTSGFVYYVSIAGITGTRAPDTAAVERSVTRIKARTPLPVVTGFGVRTPAQAGAIAAVSDGVVVGSVLVDAIAQSLDEAQRATSLTKSAVLDLVGQLSSGMKAA